jgi:hypothetical protein
MGQQPTEPQRQGYPVWAWIIAVLTFWPLPGMLVGRFIPQTRRFFRAPGIILSAVLLLAIPVTIGLIIPQPDPSASNAGPSETSSSESRNSTSKQQPTTAQKWYQGGTLYKETAAEWVKASDRDRLATSGDFATAALKGSIIWDDMDSPDDVRPYAEALKKCIDTVYDPVPIIPEMKNAETAALWLPFVG